VLLVGPVLDRNRIEPYYTGAVDVLREKDKWLMWYTSGIEWRLIDGKPEIQYQIKYAESSNGIDWVRNDISCIHPRNDYEATARPSVFHHGNKYCMLYSRRQLVNFRDDPNKGYRAGFAISDDGKKWNRLDHQIDFDVSETGWDSEAIAYPYILKFNDQFLCFYNGNGFGKSGFGYGILNFDDFSKEC
jgi:hypothetical protein